MGKEALNFWQRRKEKRKTRTELMSRTMPKDSPFHTAKEMEKWLKKENKGRTSKGNY
jgi:hypothetical protein